MFVFEGTNKFKGILYLFIDCGLILLIGLLIIMTLPDGPLFYLIVENPRQGWAFGCLTFIGIIVLMNTKYFSFGRLHKQLFIFKKGK